MTASPAGTLVKGVGALAALIAAVAGVPILLHSVAGSPIPSAAPAWDGIWASLTTRDDGTLLLGLLKYSAWAGWTLFVFSVVADVVTRFRGLPAPRLGPQQQLATQLVGAVLALAVNAPIALPATATPVDPVASASQPAAASVSSRSAPQAPAPPQASDTSDREHFEEYRVRPGDCLWDIAWNELGEPERWPEIFEASRSVSQAGGRRLTDPDLIMTGWVLHIPTAPTPETRLPGGSLSEGSPSTETPDSAQGNSESEVNAVVTPLTNRPVGTSTASPSGSESQPLDLRPRVATALNTPGAKPPVPVSTLELGWHRALAEIRHQQSGWRHNLTID